MNNMNKLRYSSWIDEPHRTMFAFLPKEMKNKAFDVFLNDNSFHSEEFKAEVERLYFGRP